MRPKLFPISSRVLLASPRLSLGSTALTILWLMASQALGQVTIVPTVSTFAGNGTVSATGADTGAGGLATSAQLNHPLSMAIDKAGNVYFTDYFGNTIQKVTLSTGLISLVAGNGTDGGAGDGGPAVNAQFNHPGGLAIDGFGNLYVGDTGNNRIRRISAATGIITTVAGNGNAGFSGDGGQATNATFNYPDPVTLDNNGDLFIADVNNYRVRKVTLSTGIITTVAGNGTQGFGGDRGLATNAQINGAYGLAFDTQNNLYVADSFNNRVREVSALTGIINTIAGNGVTGFSGDGGPATAAQLNMGYGSLDVDKSNNVYISDSNSCRIRVVAPGTGIINTVAGNGTCGYTGNGGLARNAEISDPQRVKVANANVLYIAEVGNHTIRSVSIQSTSFPETLVGTSSASQNVLLVTTAAETISSITVPQSLGATQEYVVGAITGCVVDGRTINPTGTVCTVPVTFRPAYPGERQVPLQIRTSTGSLSFGLSGVGQSPLVALTPGIISTVAGNGTQGSAGNGGAATGAQLNQARGIALDYAGNIFITDRGNNTVREVNAVSGLISILAGNGTAASTGDGTAATTAGLFNPTQSVVDGAGNLYIADSAGNRIRRVDANTGLISTVAGSGIAGFSGDGGFASTAQLNGPTSVAVDVVGNIFIADSNNHRVREVFASTGIITTIAGNGAAAYSGDNGPATSASFILPYGVYLDNADNLFVADSSSNTVRRVSVVTGTITTVAGTGTQGFTGDGGIASTARLNQPVDVKTDGAGNLYIADSGNNRVRVVNAATGIITTVAGNGTAAFNGDAGGATSAAVNAPYGVALDGTGNLYIADSSNDRIRKITVASSQLIFPTPTAFGSSDSTDDPLRATVTNIGNQALTIPPPGSGGNPSLASGFTIDSSSTCPQLSTTSAASSLAAGANCIYAIDFTPTAVGAVSGSAVLTDNSLNASGSIQRINLNGTGTAAVTSTSLVANPTTSTFGQSVTLTARVTSLGGVPPGTVTFYNGSTALGPGTLNASGVATFSTTTLPGGSDSLTAVYGATIDYLGSTSAAVIETVSKVTPTLTAPAISPVNAPYGTSVTITQTVPAGETGTVTFYSGGTNVLGSATIVNGVATLTTSALPIGTDAITAQAAGDTTYNAATSPAATDNVGKDAPSAVLTTSNASTTFGQSVTFTVTLSGLNAVSPTGTVTFFDGTGQIGTPQSVTAGVATYTTSALSVGSHNITATYNGDTNYSVVTSAVSVQTVTQGVAVVVVNGVPNPSTYTQSVSMTITVTGVNGIVPTGTVTLMDNGTALGSAITLDATGKGTFATTVLSAGSHTILATYGGDTNYR